MFPLLDLHPTVEESMVREQLRMLSYVDYVLAIGLRAADATVLRLCTQQTVQVRPFRWVCMPLSMRPASVSTGGIS